MTGVTTPLCRFGDNSSRFPVHLPAARRGSNRYSRVMTNPQSGNIGIDVTRLDKRLEVMGLSAHQASIEAMNNSDTIRNIHRSKSGNVRITTAKALARVLECDVEYLTGEQDSPRREGATALQRGAIELSNEELMLLALFRNNPEDQERILQVIQAMTGR